MINDNTKTDQAAAQTRKPRCFFISRHAGAIDWAKQHPWAVEAHFVAHLDIDLVAADDTVIGTLPVHLAAEVCARGAAYLHLMISVEAGQRGAELSAEQMALAGARLIPYRVIKADRRLGSR